MRLCKKDNKHPSLGSKSVLLLRDQFMLKINQQTNPQSDLTVHSFWELHYEPYIKSERDKGEMARSTVHGYIKLWNGLLKDHFAGKSLREYRTHHGSEFLESCVKKGLGRRSVSHAKSLSSGIFSLALRKGLIETNPWHDAAPFSKPKAPGETEHYTLEEAQEILVLLRGDLRGQTIFAVAFFTGLRPGELSGLRWEDIKDGELQVSRAVWRGKISKGKTPGSIAPVPLIAPVAVALEMWRKHCGSPTEGWVFQNNRGGPLNMTSFSARFFKPVLGPKFKGLYSCRRGLSTELITLMNGNGLGSQGMAPAQEPIDNPRPLQEGERRSRRYGR